MDATLTRTRRYPHRHPTVSTFDVSAFSLVSPGESSTEDRVEQALLRQEKIDKGRLRPGEPLPSHEMDQRLAVYAKKGTNAYCQDCADNAPSSHVIRRFGAFVCGSCAHVHRRLGHHPKGLEEEFSAYEVEDILRSGGNEAVVRVWYAEYVEVSDLTPPNTTHHRHSLYSRPE